MRTTLLSALVVAVAAPLAAQDVELKAKPKVKRDKYVITAEEIAERQDLQNGYDVVRLLRSQWLKPVKLSASALNSGTPGVSSRPATTTSCGPQDDACRQRTAGSAPSVAPRESGSPYGDVDGLSGNGRALPVLYFDEVKQPGIEELRNVRAADLVELKYMTGTQASGRYGAGHEAGAILVKTVRFAKP